MLFRAFDLLAPEHVDRVSFLSRNEEHLADAPTCHIETIRVERDKLVDIPDYLVLLPRID